MLIECMLKRDEPVIVPIGNEKYTFEPDHKGRKVAEVWLEDHIAAFLAVSHLYRELPDAKAQDLAVNGGLKRRQIMAKLKEHKVRFAATLPTGTLQEMLTDAVARAAAAKAAEAAA